MSEDNFRFSKKKYRKILTVKEEGLNPDNKIKNLATAYFDKIPSSELVSSQTALSYTLKALLDISHGLVQGNYGVLLQREVKALNEKVFSPQFMQALLRLHQASEDELPEIFSTKELKEEKERFCDTYKGQEIAILEAYLSDIDRFKNETSFTDQQTRILSYFFRQFLINETQPSHVLVQLLLEYGEPEDAAKEALLIKNPLERSKSIVAVLNNLLNHHRANEAMLLLKKMNIKLESSKPLTFLIERLFKGSKQGIQHLINQGNVKEAISLVNDIVDCKDRDQARHKLVLGLVKSDFLSLAKENAKKIEDEEMRQFTLNGCVQILASKQKFSQAKEVLGTINEISDREDARGYILKEMAAYGLNDEALSMIDEIPSLSEKMKAAKYLESIFAAKEREDLTKILQEKYFLSKLPLPHHAQDEF